MKRGILVFVEYCIICLGLEQDTDSLALVVEDGDVESSVPLPVRCVLVYPAVDEIPHHFRLARFGCSVQHRAPGFRPLLSESSHYSRL